MPEELKRLKRALASRYRIEREIGAGGMATVYLAEDVKHHRPVAVKVLRSDLAAALGAERFLREIEIAAQLQHPHILTLIDSGEADGFLYYIMPYVEGESLRAKLARERELPIAEAARILHDVVDALAHAHAHGVVHRDIKPDNVLLSGHHAVVTDFGVAKAVSEATGRNQLTTAGVALGTPAYMAPEQATADPHVDHRADIYAVGAVAYELLTGRPPFSGDSPQQVLAAHVTEAPLPVTRFRETVPPALAELVMRCLAKRPADRWQHTQQLLAPLEAFTTPSGGTTPTDTRPVATTPAAAASFRNMIRQAGSGRLARVLSVYVLASVVVLGAVRLVVSRFRLPDWFFPAAVVLLLIGLPIILTTVLIQTSRPSGTVASGAAALPWRAPQRWFTWPRAILGGVLAFAGLAVLGAGLAFLRPLGGRELNSDLIAVAPFDVLGGDDLDLWREGLVDILSRSLDGAGPLRTVSPTVVVRRWSGRADPVSAADLGRRTGAKLTVFGQLVATSGDSVRVNASLLDVERNTLVGEVEVRDRSAHMDRLADSLTVALLNELGRTRRIGAVRSAAFGSSSLAALKSFLQGEQQYRRSNWDSARVNYERAVQLDTAFALALNRLSTVLGWQNTLYDSIGEALAMQAGALNHGLPPRESLLIATDSLLHAISSSPPAGLKYQALLQRLHATADEAARRYPDDPEVWNTVGEVRYHYGAESGAPRTAALAAFDRAIALDSAFAPAYIHPVELALALDGPRAAQRYIDRYLALGPTDKHSEGIRLVRTLLDPGAASSSATARYLDTASANPISSAYLTLWAYPDSAEWGLRLARLLAEGRPGFRPWSDPETGRRQLLRQLLRRGHLQEAVRLTGPDDESFFLQLALLGAIPPDSVTGVLRRWTRDGNRWRANALWWFAAQRDTAAIQEYLAVVRARATSWEATAPTYHEQSALAYLTLARGDTASAVQRFMALPDSLCWVCSFHRLTRVRLLGATGRDRQAAALLDRDLAEFANALDVVWALERGRVNEVLERRDQAIEAYALVADAWRNADPELQPLVEEARAALGRLGGEPRR